MQKSRFDAAHVKRAAVIIRALKNAERIRMIQLLEQNKRMRPMDFAEEMGIRPNRVTLHLKMLMSVGLVKSKAITRKEVYYSLYKDRVIQIADGVRIIAIRNPTDYRDFVRFGTVA